MQLFLFGLSHKTAPVEVRELFSFSPSQLPRALQNLRAASGVREAAILSTCNRSEIYAVGADDAGKRLEQFLRDAPSVNHQSSTQQLNGYLYRRSDAESARHLFHVACGIDSLVLGESEILGQVKTAFEAARSAGVLGSMLDELFRRAISCGKRARTETSIGRGALNVGSAAVELARQIFGPLTGRTVLILGAGKMSTLTVQHLVSSGARRVIVSNRTHERAQELAQRFGEDGALSEAVHWDEFPQRLVEADIVISSTRAPQTVLSSDQVAAAMKVRRHRPLFLVDIAVPRDIDPAAHQLENVFLYDIDDLQGVVNNNLAQRAEELASVEAIIEGEVALWEKWYRARAARPVAAALAQRANQVRDAEVAAALSRLAHLSARDQEIVRQLAHSVSQKLIHSPLHHLREAGTEGSPDVDVIRRAFRLEPDIERSEVTPSERSDIEGQSKGDEDQSPGPEDEPAGADSA